MSITVIYSKLSGESDSKPEASGSAWFPFYLLLTSIIRTFVRRKENKQMDTKKTIAALFDFDGVVMDTESQYTGFWNKEGLNYLGVENFGPGIKGQTLGQIFDKYFPGMEEVHKQLDEKIETFEKEMSYEYLPGFLRFITELRANGVKTALVTSSNEKKMSNVYRVHPEIKELFDEILTAEHFTKSKPHPECFLLGMKRFGAEPSQSYVFEDSFHGLRAGMDSGATVIGLATTNPREAIREKAHHIIDDFTGMTYDRLLLMSKEQQ